MIGCLIKQKIKSIKEKDFINMCFLLYYYTINYFIFLLIIIYLYNKLYIKYKL